MPESEHEKEIRRQQAELERSMREEGETPIPDDPKPGEGDSIFTREAVPTDDSAPRRSAQDVKVTQGVGGDGMEDSSVKDILRELVQVTRALHDTVIQLGQG